MYATTRQSEKERERERERDTKENVNHRRAKEEEEEEEEKLAHWTINRSNDDDDDHSIHHFIIIPPTDKLSPHRVRRDILFPDSGDGQQPHRRKETSIEKEVEGVYLNRTTKTFTCLYQRWFFPVRLNFQLLLLVTVERRSR